MGELFNYLNKEAFKVNVALMLSEIIQSGKTSTIGCHSCVDSTNRLNRLLCQARQRQTQRERGREQVDSSGGRVCFFVVVVVGGWANKREREREKNPSLWQFSFSLAGFSCHLFFIYNKLSIISLKKLRTASFSSAKTKEKYWVAAHGVLVGVYVE